MITAKAPAPVIRAAARRAGMVSLFEDAIQKVLDGKTTLEEVMPHSEF